MTILHSGTTKTYSTNWAQAFGEAKGAKSSKSSGKAAAKKKPVAKKKSAKKKSKK